MFHALHRLTKIAAWLALAALVLAVWGRRAAFERAAGRYAHVRQLVPTDLARGVAITGRVLRLRTPTALELRDAAGAVYLLQLAGLEPPAPGPAALAVRQVLGALVVSQEVRAVTTVLTPRRGGLALFELGGTNLNAWLAAEGLARTSTNALEAVPMRDQLDLLAAEAQARKARRGLWR
jgi:hypothetical protein